MGSSKAREYSCCGEPFTPSLSPPSFLPLTGGGLQERAQNRAVTSSSSSSRPLALWLALAIALLALFVSLKNIRPLGRAVFYDVCTRKLVSHTKKRELVEANFLGGSHTKMICRRQQLTKRSSRSSKQQQQSLRSFSLLCLLPPLYS